jgi:hypothetical protein
LAPIDHSSTFNLSPQQAKSAGLKQVEVPLVTLNQVVGSHGNRIPEIVKIDAEGFDLKVIDGASNLVGKTEVFFLEAAVCARDIENDLPAVIRKMAELGYVPFDITELNYSPQQDVLWLVEVMFALSGGKIISMVGTNY